MKRCPRCQQTYPDDAPGFCANDGTELVTEASQPYSNPAPPPPAGAQPPQANWPPPPQGQGQNWAGGYYQQQPGQPGAYAPTPPPPHYPQPAAGRHGLSIASFIIGIVSFLAVVMIFLMAQRIVPPDRDVAEVCFWGSAVAGLIAVVLGILALISRRQRNRWMGILGLVLGIPAILFFAYVMFAYNSF